ncbi:MAG: amidohydrolase [Treponema sp.]|nr:amidohydrolase [Treponema sp.]
MNIDLLIKGNAIFDCIGNEPFAGFVAIAGNKIAKTGKGEAPAEFAGVKTIDAGERLVMPGFHDSHTHMTSAGFFMSCKNLEKAASADEAARMIYEFSKTVPSDEFIIGGGWYHLYWKNPVEPSKADLDKYIPDRPVFLMQASGHCCWLNSKALEVCNITKETVEPEAGKIIRDANGEPAGLLYDGAMNLATAKAFKLNKGRIKEYVTSYMQRANSLGLTSVTDVMPDFTGDIGYIPAYAQIEKEGAFTMRVHAAPSLFDDLDEVLEWQKKYTSEKLTVTHVKQFMDGVTSNHTALLLENYLNEPRDKGIVTCPLEKIKKTIAEAHKRGLSVRLHAIGDRTVRYALDYIEEAIKQHGKKNVRHSIEHCELCSDEDIPRFGRLGVIPSVQPEHVAMVASYDANPYPALLGEERTNKAFPFRKYLDAAGVLAFGTDHPVIDNNPLPGIYRAKTRLFNDHKPEGGWAPSEKLDLATALKMYTWGSAYNCFRENELGTLKAGNFADIVILDRNLFAVTDDEIKDAKADYTIFDGKSVYER